MDVDYDVDANYGINSDVDMTKEEESSLLDSSKKAKGPKDRLYAVFFIFGFLGLASLMPWNFFITAKSYFDYKFRNTSNPNDTGIVDPKNPTHLQYTFESYLAMVSNGSNFILMVLTTLLVRWISVRTRIITSTLIIMVVFIVTTVMVKVDTDDWQDKFLMFTLITASIMSGSQSVLTGSVLGLSATFPIIYSQSAMIGQAAGGTFSALASIMTKTGGGPVESGFIFFLIAAALTVMALISFLFLNCLPFSTFYMAKKDTPFKQIKPDVHSDDEDRSKSKVAFLWIVFKKIWIYCVSVCLIFLVTLSIFPAVCAIINTTSTEKTQWTQTYFTPVVCFLLFNLGDFIGRLATFICKFPGIHRPVWILVLSCLRVAFIPLIMLCNAQPRNHLPVVFNDDAIPIVLISLVGLTNGYLGTLCMSFGPVYVDIEEAEGAGTLLALSITGGLSGGSFLSMGLLQLL